MFFFNIFSLELKLLQVAFSTIWCLKPTLKYYIAIPRHSSKTKSINGSIHHCHQLNCHLAEAYGGKQSCYLQLITPEESREALGCTILMKLQSSTV